MHGNGRGHSALPFPEFRSLLDVRAAARDEALLVRQAHTVHEGGNHVSRGIVDQVHAVGIFYDVVMQRLERLFAGSAHRISGSQQLLQLVVVNVVDGASGVTIGGEGVERSDRIGVARILGQQDIPAVGIGVGRLQNGGVNGLDLGVDTGGGQEPAPEQRNWRRCR